MTERRYKENAEMIGFMRRMIRAMGRRAGSDIDTLPMLAQLQAELDRELHRAVTDCRTEGYSWTDIGARLGVTRQAAYQRFTAKP